MTKNVEAHAFDTDELLALARLALEHNDIEGALTKLKPVLASENPPAEAVGLGARVYAQLGLYPRAERLYERYLEAHPKAILEQFQLGMTRFDAGRPAEAVQVWDDLLERHPEHPPALFYKALALVRTGKTGDAKTILDRAVKTIPADNLYFGRSKELLQAIDSGADEETTVTKGNGNARFGAPPAPYRTEH